MARLLRVAFVVTLTAAVLRAATINEREDDDETFENKSVTTPNENESIRDKREPSASRTKRQFIIPGRRTLAWGLRNSQSGSRSSGVHRQFSNFNTVNSNVGHLTPAVDSGGNVVIEPGRIIFQGPLLREPFIQSSNFVSNRPFEQTVQDSIVTKLQPELAFNLPSGQLQGGLVGSQQGFQGSQQGQQFGQSQQGNQQFGQQQKSVQQQNGQRGNHEQQQSLHISPWIWSPFQPSGFSRFPGFLQSVFSRQLSQSQGQQGSQGGGSQFSSGTPNVGGGSFSTGGAEQQSQGGSGGQKQQQSSFASSGGIPSIQPTGRQSFVSSGHPASSGGQVRPHQARPEQGFTLRNQVQQQRQKQVLRGELVSHQQLDQQQPQNSVRPSQRLLLDQQRPQSVFQALQRPLLDQRLLQNVFLQSQRPVQDQQQQDIFRSSQHPMQDEQQLQGLSQISHSPIQQTTIREPQRFHPEQLRQSQSPQVQQQIGRGELERQAQQPPLQSLQPQPTRQQQQSERTQFSQQPPQQQSRPHESSRQPQQHSFFEQQPQTIGRPLQLQSFQQQPPQQRVQDQPRAIGIPLPPFSLQEQPQQQLFQDQPRAIGIPLPPSSLQEQPQQQLFQDQPRAIGIPLPPSSLQQQPQQQLFQDQPRAIGIPLPPSSLQEQPQQQLFQDQLQAIGIPLPPISFQGQPRLQSFFQQQPQTIGRPLQLQQPQQQLFQDQPQAIGIPLPPPSFQQQPQQQQLQDQPQVIGIPLPPPSFQQQPQQQIFEDQPQAIGIPLPPLSFQQQHRQQLFQDQPQAIGIPLPPPSLQQQPQQQLFQDQPQAIGIPLPPPSFQQQPQQQLLQDQPQAIGIPLPPPSFQQQPQQQLLQDQLQAIEIALPPPSFQQQPQQQLLQDQPQAIEIALPPPSFQQQPQQQIFEDQPQVIGIPLPPPTFQQQPQQQLFQVQPQAIGIPLPAPSFQQQPQQQLFQDQPQAIAIPLPAPSFRGQPQQQSFFQQQPQTIGRPLPLLQDQQTQLLSSQRQRLSQGIAQRQSPALQNQLQQIQDLQVLQRQSQAALQNQVQQGQQQFGTPLSEARPGSKLSSTALTRRVGLASPQDIEIRHAVRVRPRQRYSSSRSRLTQGSTSVKFNRNYQAPSSSYSYDNEPVVDISLDSPYDVVEVRIRDGNVLDVNVRDSKRSKAYQKKRYYSSEERSRGGAAVEDLILRLEADEIVKANADVNKEEAQHEEQNPTQQESSVISNSNNSHPPVKEELAIEIGSSEGDSPTHDDHLYTISLSDDQVLSVLSNAGNPIDGVSLEKETGRIDETTALIKNESELMTIEDALQAFTTGEEAASASEEIVAGEGSSGSTTSGDQSQSALDEHSSSLDHSDFENQTDQSDAETPIDSFQLEEETGGIDESMALIETESELITIEDALQAITTSDEVASVTEEVVTGEGSSDLRSSEDQSLSSLDVDSSSLDNSDFDFQTESTTKISDDQSTSVDSSDVNHESIIDIGSSDPSSSADQFGVNDIPTEPTSSLEDISIDIQLGTETGSNNDGSSVLTQNSDNVDDQSESSTSKSIDYIVMQVEDFSPLSDTAEQTILAESPQSPSSDSSLFQTHGKTLIEADQEIAQAIAQSGSHVGGRGDDDTIIQPNGKTLTEANQEVAQTLTQSSSNAFEGDGSTLVQPHGKTLITANQEVAQILMQTGSIINEGDDSTLVQPHGKTLAETNQEVVQFLTQSGSNAGGGGDGTLVPSHGRTLSESNREVAQTLLQTGSKFSGCDDSTPVQPHGKTLTEANQEVAQTVIGSNSIASVGVDSTSHVQPNGKSFDEANQEFTQSLSESGSNIKGDDTPSTFRHGSKMLHKVTHEIPQSFSETGSKFHGNTFDKENQEVTREFTDSTSTIREGDDAKPEAAGNEFSTGDASRKKNDFSSHATQVSGHKLNRPEIFDEPFILNSRAPIKTVDDTTFNIWADGPEIFVPPSQNNRLSSNRENSKQLSHPLELPSHVLPHESLRTNIATPVIRSHGKATNERTKEPIPHFDRQTNFSDDEISNLFSVPIDLNINNRIPDSFKHLSKGEIYLLLAALMRKNIIETITQSDGGAALSSFDDENGGFTSLNPSLETTQQTQSQNSFHRAKSTVSQIQSQSKPLSDANNKAAQILNDDVTVSKISNSEIFGSTSNGLEGKTLTSTSNTQPQISFRKELHGLDGGISFNQIGGKTFEIATKEGANEFETRPFELSDGEALYRTHLEGDHGFDDLISSVDNVPTTQIPGKSLVKPEQQIFESFIDTGSSLPVKDTSVTEGSVDLFSHVQTISKSVDGANQEGTREISESTPNIVQQEKHSTDAINNSHDLPGSSIPEERASAMESEGESSLGSISEGRALYETQDRAGHTFDDLFSRISLTPPPDNQGIHFQEENHKIFEIEMTSESSVTEIRQSTDVSLGKTLGSGGEVETLMEDISTSDDASKGGIVSSGANDNQNLIDKLISVVKESMKEDEALQITSNQKKKFILPDSLINRTDDAVHILLEEIMNNVDLESIKSNGSTDGVSTSTRAENISKASDFTVFERTNIFPDVSNVATTIQVVGKSLGEANKQEAQIVTLPEQNVLVQDQNHQDLNSRLSIVHSLGKTLELANEEVAQATENPGEIPRTANQEESVVTKSKSNVHKVQKGLPKAIRFPSTSQTKSKKVDKANPNDGDTDLIIVVNDNTNDKAVDFGNGGNEVGDIFQNLMRLNHNSGPVLPNILKNLTEDSIFILLQNVKENFDSETIQNARFGNNAFEHPRVEVIYASSTLNSTLLLLPEFLPIIQPDRDIGDSSPNIGATVHSVADITDLTRATDNPILIQNLGKSLDKVKVNDKDVVVNNIEFGANTNRNNIVPAILQVLMNSIAETNKQFAQASKSFSEVLTQPELNVPEPRKHTPEIGGTPTIVRLGSNFKETDAATTQSNVIIQNRVLQTDPNKLSHVHTFIQSRGKALEETNGGSVQSMLKPDSNVPRLLSSTNSQNTDKILEADDQEVPEIIDGPQTISARILRVPSDVARKTQDNAQNIEHVIFADDFPNGESINDHFEGDESQITMEESNSGSEKINNKELDSFIVKDPSAIDSTFREFLESSPVGIDEGSGVISDSIASDVSRSDTIQKQTNVLGIAASLTDETKDLEKNDASTLIQNIGKSLDSANKEVVQSIISNVPKKGKTIDASNKFSNNVIKSDSINILQQKLSQPTEFEFSSSVQNKLQTVNKPILKSASDFEQGTSTMTISEHLASFLNHINRTSTRNRSDQDTMNGSEPSNKNRQMSSLVEKMVTNLNQQNHKVDSAAIVSNRIPPLVDTSVPLDTTNILNERIEPGELKTQNQETNSNSKFENEAHLSTQPNLRTSPDRIGSLVANIHSPTILQRSGKTLGEANQQVAQDEVMPGVRSPQTSADAPLDTLEMGNSASHSIIPHLDTKSSQSVFNAHPEVEFRGTLNELMRISLISQIIGKSLDTANSEVARVVASSQQNPIGVVDGITSNLNDIQQPSFFLAQMQNDTSASMTQANNSQIMSIDIPHQRGQDKRIDIPTLMQILGKSLSAANQEVAHASIIPRETSHQNVAEVILNQQGPANDQIKVAHNEQEEVPKESQPSKHLIETKNSVLGINNFGSGKTFSSTTKNHTQGLQLDGSNSATILSDLDQGPSNSISDSLTKLSAIMRSLKQLSSNNAVEGHVPRNAGASDNSIATLFSVLSLFPDTARLGSGNEMFRNVSRPGINKGKEIGSSTHEPLQSAMKILMDKLVQSTKPISHEQHVLDQETNTASSSTSDQSSAITAQVRKKSTSIMQSEGAGLIQGAQQQGAPQLSREINSGSNLGGRFQFTIVDQGVTAGSTPFAGRGSQAIATFLR